MNTIPKRRIVMGIAAIAAALFLIITYGTAMLAAPTMPVQLNGPTAACSDGNYTAVSDSESARVLIMNSDNDLTGYIDCTTLDSPFNAVTDVCVSDGIIYVSGVLFAPDSNYIEKERVAAYDKGGNFRGVIFELEGSIFEEARIKNLSSGENGTIIAYTTAPDFDSESLEYPITFEFANLQGTETLDVAPMADDFVYDVAYVQQLNQYAALTRRGMVVDGENKTPHSISGRVLTAIDLGSDGKLYACDDMHSSICVVSGNEAHDLLGGFQYDRIHCCNGVLCATDLETNSITTCDTNGEHAVTFSSVVPSLGYSVRMIFVWAAALYLIALFVVYVARKIRKAIATGRTKNLDTMLASVAVVVAVGVAIAGLSYSSYQNAKATRANEISLCADYIELSTRNAGAAFERFGGRHTMRADDEFLGEKTSELSAAIQPATWLAVCADSNNIGLYYTVYGKDDDGIYYMFDSSMESVMGTSVPDSWNGGVVAKVFAGDMDIGQELHTGRMLRDTTLYRLVPIMSTDESSVVGVVEIGSKMRTFEISLLSLQAQQLLAIFVILLVVFLSYSELRACGKCLLSYRDLQKHRARDAAAVLTRPFTFFVTMLTSIDGIMTVLIARDLLEKMGLDSSGPFLVLPSLMLGVGMVVGQAGYSRLGSRVALRRLMGGGALAMLMFAMATAFIVSQGNFWLYCCAKLAMSVSLGLLYTLGYSLPRFAETEETRKMAAGGVRRTDNSAAAFGTVLGGYAAQVLGNAWVYALIAAACLPIILMAVNLASKDSRPPEDDAREADATHRVRLFLRSRNALALALLIVLPATIAAGYTSFLFPLFSADLGLEKSEINNISALGQLIVYLSISSIDGVEGRYGKWRVSTAAIAAIGCVFLLFSLNTTLVWSIAVIAIIGVLGKSSNGWKGMWLHSANEAGVPAGTATSAMFAARSLAMTAQPFMLGALLGHTDSAAVIVIGVLCVACAALFFLTTRRTSLPDL